ncbi:MAG: RDD family protein, partial [bacterium]|nr:RDD family protein [bacterium]
MAKGSRSKQGISYLGRIDRELLGLKGLTGTYDGLFVLLLVPVSLILSLMSVYIDDARLGRALELAVNPLSVLLGIGGLLLIARFAGQAIDGGEGEDESVTSQVATLVAATSGVALLAIVFHRLLPEGDLSRLVGAAILLLVAISFAMVVVGRRVVAYHGRLNRAKRAKSQTLPLLRKSAWVVDVAIWFSHILLAAVIWYSAMGFLGAQRVDSTYFWVLTTGTATFHATQVCLLGLRGFTLGHLFAAVRVANVQNGEPMGWRQSALRTTIPLVCVYVVLLFAFNYPLGMDADGGGAKYLALVAASAMVVAASLAGFMSYLLLREIHAHGQGLLDLACRTASYKNCPIDCFQRAFVEFRVDWIDS